MGCILQGNLASWRSPQGKGTVIPLPWGKPQPSQPVYLVYSGLYEYGWHKSTCTYVKGLDPGRGIGCSMRHYHQSCCLAGSSPALLHPLPSLNATVTSQRTCSTYALTLQRHTALASEVDLVLCVSSTISRQRQESGRGEGR